MKQHHKISVCMITYGHEKFIEQAINGVLMQDCGFEVELIIANDCSLDKTDEIIRNILKNHPRASWIKYIKHDKNLGMMPNFIYAIKECNGKYIALCEGDDYWTDPFKLQKQVDFLENNDDFVLCFHQVNILKTDGEIVEDFITRVPKNYETMDALANLGNYIHTPSVIFRNVIKLYPPEFEQSPIGDYFLYMMLVEHGKIKYIEEKMAVYRYGVGVYSKETNTNMLMMMNKQYACLLSWLKDDEVKKIILRRNFLLIDSFESNFRCKYFTNNFIEKNKSFLSLANMMLQKIKRWFLKY